MKWTVKIVAEGGPGELMEEEVVTIEREDLITPASIGLTIEEGKGIQESLQRRIVAPRWNVMGQVSSLVPGAARGFARRAITNRVSEASTERCPCVFGV